MLSICWPQSGGGSTTKEFQFKQRDVFVLCSSQYLSVNWLKKFVGKAVDGVWPVTEGVDGSERVSGSDKAVSDEKSIGSSTEFGSPWENVCDEVFVMK